MIRWREERRRSFRAIAVVLVALLVGGFVRIVLGLVAAAGTANAAAGVAIVVVGAALALRTSRKSE